MCYSHNTSRQPCLSEIHRKKNKGIISIIFPAHAYITIHILLEKMIPGSNMQ